MPDPADRLLVIAATDRELAPLVSHLEGVRATSVHGVTVRDATLEGVPVRVAVTGVARAATAFHLARLLLDRPAAVVQIGVGGGFGLPLGAVAVATHDTYGDLGCATETGWLPAAELGLPLLVAGGTPIYDTFPCHPALVAAAAGELSAPAGGFVTVETITGTHARADELAARHRPLIESMEGAAAAHACTADGVPFVELRAVSNPVGPRDRERWRLEQACAAACAALRRCIGRLAEVAWEVRP